jgi:hypothetical protein
VPPPAACDDWKPTLYDVSSSDDHERLRALVESGEVQFRHDTIGDQLEELVAAREPARKLSRDETAARVRAHLGHRTLDTHGTWVYYPWSRRLVHVLPVDELREVRTDRNRYKITAEEQARLATFRIGVIGLSVGNMAAVTCALEGIGTRFRIADFDKLSLSNLNRLRGGLHELGVDKTTIAAREMFEIDPYLEIERFAEGVTRDNVDRFLLGDGAEGGRLDLVVEECDDLYLKVMVRERARALRIPVVMDTSDRGLLDVERFDREPARPVLHGLMGAVRAESLLGLSTRDKVPYVLAILGENALSTRMAASLPEVNESISSWPQLASSVALGGALAADIARRILLGQHSESGRYYVDTEAIVRDGTGALREGSPPSPSTDPSPEALRPPDLPPMPRPHEAHPEAIRWMVAHAVLAPSAHNAQPWRFRFANGTLACIHDPTHDLPTLDFEHGATWVAFGAMLVNLEMAAAAIGLVAEVDPFPGGAEERLVARVRFRRGLVVRDPLLEWVPRRVTNRRHDRTAEITGLDAAVQAKLHAATGPRARLKVLATRGALDELGALMGACDRITAFNEAIHRETMPGYRWTREEVEAHRDGIDVLTLELSPADRAGVRLLSHWPTIHALCRLGGGRVLEDGAAEAIAAARAAGLVTVPGTTRENYLEGGRAVQRVWLTAAANGVAIQPMTSLPYLMARLERGGGEGLSLAERQALGQLRPRYRGLFDTPATDGEVLLFRLHVGDPPTVRSLRRRVDDLITFD